MSYSDFTLDELKTQFNLTLQERVELFQSIAPISPSALLTETLAENLQLALEIDTEKARSELIVAPILVELRKHFNREISLFSGTEFNIDKTKGLSGRCDFIISHSSEQLMVTAPVATIVEAKNDNIKSGIPQCIAEMLAAQLFNQQKNNNIPCIYGIITTGSIWKFLKLVEDKVYLESKEHFINNLELILGILSHIIDTTRPNP
ncbi:MAG TPA: hypothetical protein DEA78_21210 [Cyanobacteria bacterium UBA11159]|nr:hypothetical protein [Cyanobacteria bacterium UBA11367]HBE60067.1 hypothetical protein [Cyanobacteria bacterium UBA11366]HBK64835.1 hypothetical protein [Cyanobacteria bacterium UBA11166]HBR76151.1 hypothetical protein [Cyanobacteria bacterium UBA11159]HBS72504.1 hypothetical protein [Cyanobacteria bacterium UBA11153]HCA97249.1 hypothetical protein [Cyanobacteria bacterium UBA9226]